MSHLFVFWLVESSIVCYFISDKQRCATPIRSLDDDCSAGRSYRRAWRASNRRPHTHATSIFSLSYNPSFPSMKYVAEKVLERALTFTRFFYMNRNSGLTTLSGSSIAVRACPRHRAVRAPRGTKHDGGSLRQQNEYSKSGLTTLKRGSKGNGKTRVLFYAAQTPGLHFSASVREYSYEQTVWFSKRSVFK